MATVDKFLLREVMTPPRLRTSTVIEHRGFLNKDNPNAVLAFFSHDRAHNAIKLLTIFTRCEVIPYGKDTYALAIEGERACSSYDFIKQKRTKLSIMPIRSAMKIYPLSGNAVVEAMKLSDLRNQKKAEPKIKLTPAQKRFEAEMNMQAERP